jgi:hypothetical protein
MIDFLETVLKIFGAVVPSMFGLYFLLLCLTDGNPKKILAVFKKKKRNETVITDILDPQEAINILCTKLLGDNYYVVDPVGCFQANSIIVKDILKKYTDDEVYVICTKEVTDE